MKYCSLCEQSKPTKEFYIYRGKFLARCRECFIALQNPKKAAILISAKQQRDEAWIQNYVLTPGLHKFATGSWPTNETWLAVCSYPAKYEVSDHGRVRSYWVFRRDEYWKRPVPKVLIPNINSVGYATVSLIDWCSGTQTTHSVHSLMLTAFRGPRPSDRHVCGHRDGNPLNNHISNLAWITWEENEADKRRHGRMLLGAHNHQSKLTDSKVRAMRSGRECGSSFRELGKEFGVSSTTAHRIVTRRMWKHVA